MSSADFRFTRSPICHPRKARISGQNQFVFMVFAGVIFLISLLAVVGQFVYTKANPNSTR
jgi:hypothetical protein